MSGALVGLAVVLGIVAPFDGVPPRPGTDELAPAKIKVQVLAAGQFDVQPVGTVLEPTAFPLPGERGGPKFSVTVRNIAGIPLRVRVRLFGLSATLDQAVKVRGSVAGSVVLNGPLGRAADWSTPSGVLRSGQQSTLRIRFKLLDGLPAEAWRGRLDERQLEFDAVQVDGTPLSEATTPVQTTTPDAPGASTPTSPGAGTTTPQPKLGPPLPGTKTVMGTVMESATSDSDLNAPADPPPSTPAVTTP